MDLKNIFIKAGVSRLFIWGEIFDTSAQSAIVSFNPY